MLLILFGNIGTGKTSIAKELSKRINGELIHFDNVMWLTLNKNKIYNDKDEFLITLEEIQKVYDSMHEISKFLLQKEKNVILESMYFKKQRDEAIQVAKKMNIPYLLIEITCDEQIIKQRLENRKKEYPQTPGFNLYLQYRDMMEKEESKHLIVNTSNKSVKECIEEILEKIRNGPEEI